MTKAVLTTGANSGIGLATALEVARRGFRSVGSVRSADKAEVVEKAAADAGVDVETVILDVNDDAACRRIVPGLHLYGLVNNAGYGLTRAIEDVEDGEARGLLETMVISPMRLARLALPSMREQGGGRIVNLSSVMGVTSSPLSGWYQGAKHGLEALSDALRMEVAAAGVKVVVVEPGGFRTSIWDDFERDLAGRDQSRYGSSYRRMQSAIQVFERFMGEPAAVGRVVAGAIASSRPRARYVVGYDAWAAVVADRLTPTPVKDRVLRLILGL